ncbi:MAG: hypothetical protein FJZ90_09195, partial [Chloroflexi bacterium]|nr:hypothetical protein [Chloroflexota bacterium]
EPALESLVAGEWVHTPAGRCLRVERRYPYDHTHGAERLDALLRVPTHQWASFADARDGPPLDPRSALFLDTETTGLMRGAGTYVFLVGLAFYDADSLTLRQYFMPDYGDEEALLDLVAEELEAHRGLVSFNGRCFDWPLLRTRFILARRAFDESPPHLDLLPLSRRLWRKRLPSCSLGSLEQNILGLARRPDDVPGYLIPQLYQDYLQQGRVAPMARVFYHNETDILSMVSLAARIGRLLSGPSVAQNDPSCDLVALGALYEQLQRTDEALQAYRLASEGRVGLVDARRGSREADLRLAALLKRLGRHDEAMQAWRRQLQGDALHPYVELAKHLEHRLGDHAAAKSIVLEAMDWLQRQRSRTPPSAFARAMAELEHRLARLEGKLPKSGRAEG